MELVSEADSEGVHKIGKLSVASWILYDLANTIFSLNIVSLYFSLWVVNVMGGTDALYGRADSLSMAFVLICAPALGALSDQLPRRLYLLIGSTLACIFFTLLLGSSGLIVSLAFFVAANFFFQSALIFYDSLLSEVSNKDNRGRVGGLGVGIGYLGSVVGIVAGTVVLHLYPGDYPAVFRTTAILYLIFALPGFFLIRERRKIAQKIGLATLRQAFAQVGHTIRRTRNYPGLGRFLVGRVFYADAANTLVVFMSIYVTNELHYTTGQAQIVLLIGIITAVIGGISWGFVVDRSGPKRSLNLVLMLWVLVLFLAAFIPWFGWPTQLFWVVAAIAGFTLGGTWSADRPYMLLLSPPRYLGQFYGLYSMVGRFSAVIGPLLWGFVADSLGWGRPAAVLSLVLMVLIAFVILQRVSDEPRDWGPENLPQESAA